VLDAGTRVGRFMIQDALGHVWKPLGRTSWYPSILATSALIVAGWGYFLWQGVKDPLGGINSLWPLFGIANQLLAAIALCVATTILIKMHGAKYMWITCVPLAWLVVVCFSAGWEKLFSDAPRIGFLAQVDQLQQALDAGKIAAAKVAETQTVIFNAKLDAVITGLFLVMVATVLIDSLRVWIGILRGTRDTRVNEAPFVPSALRPEEI
jgi:carbon starvation protein